MSATAIAERPTQTVSLDDDLGHLVCCDYDLAMCGLYVPSPEYPWCDDEEPTCPLCCYIEDEGLPCPVPGCPGDGGAG